MTIKEQLLKLGMRKSEIDSHESDLYVLKNEISEKFISSYGYKNNVTTFIDNIEKKVWYDIPFGYMEEHFKQCHKKED